MRKVKLTVTESRCRGGCCKTGDTFVVEDLCPPICHELWNTIYPSVYALLNGGTLDHGAEKATCFDAFCPDECRVHKLRRVELKSVFTGGDPPILRKSP